MNGFENTFGYKSFKLFTMATIIKKSLFLKA